MSDVHPPTLTLAQLAQCPQRNRFAHHWRDDKTCLCYPENFDIDAAPECGAKQMGGMAVCKLKVPVAHIHFWWPDDDNPMSGGVRWQTGTIDVGGQT